LGFTRFSLVIFGVIVEGSEGRRGYRRTIEARFFLSERWGSFREVWEIGRQVGEFFLQGDRSLDGCLLSFGLFALLSLPGILRPVAGLCCFLAV